MVKLDIIRFCEKVISEVSKANSKKINIRTLEERNVTSECKKDLVMKDGCMQTVGETEIFGNVYEMRIEVMK